MATTPHLYTYYELSHQLFATLYRTEFLLEYMHDWTPTKLRFKYIKTINNNSIR